MKFKDWDLSHRLILGYSLSKDYLKEIGKKNLDAYALDQAILYLALPYAFHVGGGVSLIISLIFKKIWHAQIHGILVFVLLTTMLIVLYVVFKMMKRKFNLPYYHYLSEQLNQEPVDTSKRLQQRATLFFVFQLILFLLIEIPAIFLL